MIRQRVISAIFIAVLLVSAVLWLPALWSTVALSAILLLGAWEWSALAAPGRVAPRLAFMVAAIALCATWWLASSGAEGLQAVLWGALAGWSFAALWVFVLPHHARRALVVAAGLMALPFAWVALARMRLDWPEGRYVVLYALLIVWLADSGASPACCWRCSAAGISSCRCSSSWRSPSWWACFPWSGISPRACASALPA
jgi:phosphatidate cytidylyltransferase